MTKLSVNINKVATLRNARGGNLPDVVRFAQDCERFGAQGITVHPRPDERHIRRTDVFALSKVVSTEFNIEGYPDERFTDIVLQAHPTQVTLVPDSPDQLTSNHGWNTIAKADMLKPLIDLYKSNGIRVSLFVDPDPEMVEGACRLQADRVELFTGPYAEIYAEKPTEALKMYEAAAVKARQLGLGLNAGHDLSLLNLKAFHDAFPWTAEVSIGHALIADALYLGIEQTIIKYKSLLQ